ncbi:BatD family protein [Agrobacterium bohemicum]|uniref:Oxygen tolerance protein BatD n=1 Tax=Agrobacterium bohemicum TaxID=2052828 RepID=A0A135P7Z6_9HYPH|nr:BatD family protein [Agrobacterium bohemicum]KXG87555.1 hypothetical protein ATO67_18050 [Agrobacterium bohemicum]
MKLVVVLFIMFTSMQAQASEPFGRASILEAKPIVPGQQVHVVVEVFAPDFFTSPPQFPLFDALDALVTLPDGSAQNMVQTIDGVQYSGIRRSYAVVPEKAGSFSLPDIGIDLGYSANGTPVKVVVQVKLPTFEVANGPSASAVPFAAKDLSISQSFDRDASTLKAGDALSRTVVVFAEDTQAMLIPPVDFGKPDGVTQYLKPPVLGDGVVRRGMGRSEETGSTRTQTVVYMTTSEGRFSLPEVSYPWFDVDGGAVSTTTLPATDVVIARQEVEAERIAPKLEENVTASGKSERRWWLVALLASALGLVILVFIQRRSSAIGAWAKRLREKRWNTPRRRLKRLRAIITYGGEFAIYRALQDWSGSLGYPTLSDWVEAQANPVLTAQTTILDRRLFRSQDVTLDRRALALAVKLPKQTRVVAKGALPELNPTAKTSLLPPL